MAIITEDYVNFETAKLLKEKRFPQEYDDYHALVYNEEDYEDEYEVQRMVLETKLVKAGTLSSYPISVPEPKCYCCTLQMAMKWLREVHNIHIELNWDKGNQLYSFQIWKPRKYNPEISSLDLWRVYKDGSYLGEWDYEEACEVAIKYCLENLI